MVCKSVKRVCIGHSGKKAVLSLLVCSMLLALSGCASGMTDMHEDSYKEEASARIFNGESGYYGDYTAEKSGDVFMVSGTAHMNDSSRMVLKDVTAEENTSILLRGNISGIKGNIRLVYNAPDGAQTFIADSENYNFDMTIEVAKGDGSIAFMGDGKRESCDFDIQITRGEGVSSEAAESSEDIETMDSPIVDNWPESIAFVSKGTTAQPYSVSILIEEPMELSVFCIKDEGKIGMRITNADGKVYFEEKKMQTESYTVMIDRAGEYTFAFYAREYYGKLTIQPAE